MYILNGKKKIKFFINSDKANITVFSEKNPANHIINIFIKRLIFEYYSGQFYWERHTHNSMDLKTENMMSKRPHPRDSMGFFMISRLPA